MVQKCAITVFTALNSFLYLVLQKRGARFSTNYFLIRNASFRSEMSIFVSKFNFSIRSFTKNVFFENFEETNCDLVIHYSDLATCKNRLIFVLSSESTISCSLALKNCHVEQISRPMLILIEFLLYNIKVQNRILSIRISDHILLGIWVLD